MLVMNTFKAIRERLGVTQAALADGLGCTQGNVGHYEKGQTVPPPVAKKLIEFGARKGVLISYEEIYGAPETTRVKRPRRAQAEESARA